MFDDLHALINFSLVASHIVTHNGSGLNRTFLVSHSFLLSL